MIDCASSVDRDFDPADLLIGRGITTLDALIVTNYDDDHVRGPALWNSNDQARTSTNHCSAVRGASPSCFCAVVLGSIAFEEARACA
jgi:hypothetical protein